jgi:hypothetical protein
MAEAVAVLALFATLIMTIVTVGRLQWLGLGGAHVSRLQAFRYAFGERLPTTARLRVLQAARPALLGPGGRRFGALRHELDVEDKGMVTAQAAIPVQIPHVRTPGWRMRRHTSVLAYAGHAAGDRQAQDRIAASPQAWRRVAAPGLATGRKAASKFQGVDRGWSRAAPVFDWLTPWADLVPPARVHAAHRAQGQP